MPKNLKSALRDDVFPGGNRHGKNKSACGIKCNKGGGCGIRSLATVGGQNQLDTWGPFLSRTESLKRTNLQRKSTFLSTHATAKKTAFMGVAKKEIVA